MSIQVNDFQYIQGKNDSEYIKLLKDALERQKQITNKAVHRIKELSNREKQVDCISRQAAIDALDKRFDNIPMEQTAEILKLRKDLRELPTIQPEPKTGKWIGTEFDGYADGNPVFYEWQCSECGCIFEDEEPTYNFCPECGAKMTNK